MPGGLGFEYRRAVKAAVLDPKVFPVCRVKEVDLGLLRRVKYFIHFDGRRWSVLRVTSDRIEKYVFE